MTLLDDGVIPQGPLPRDEAWTGDRCEALEESLRFGRGGLSCLTLSLDTPQTHQISRGCVRRGDPCDGRAVGAARSRQQGQIQSHAARNELGQSENGGRRRGEIAEPKCGRAERGKEGSRAGWDRSAARLAVQVVVVGWMR